MSQLSHPPTLFAHPFVLWTALRARRTRRAAARLEQPRARWDQAAWQRWADHPPTHPLVAGGPQVRAISKREGVRAHTPAA